MNTEMENSFHIKPRSIVVSEPFYLSDERIITFYNSVTHRTNQYINVGPLSASRLTRVIEKIKKEYPNDIEESVMGAGIIKTIGYHIERI